MAGIVGTVGMLAEASGYGAVVDVASVPGPEAPARAGADVTTGRLAGLLPRVRHGDRRPAGRLAHALAPTP